MKWKLPCSKWIKKRKTTLIQIDDVEESYPNPNRWWKGKLPWTNLMTKEKTTLIQMDDDRETYSYPNG